MGTQPTRVDEEVYERFKQAVRAEYGSERGVLKYEVQRALEERAAALRGDDVLQGIDEANRKMDTILEILDGDSEAPPQTDSGEKVRARAKSDVDTTTEKDEESQEIQTDGSASWKGRLPDLPSRPHDHDSRRKKGRWVALSVLHERAKDPNGGMIDTSTKISGDHALAKKVREEFAFDERVMQAILDAASEKTRDVAKEALDAEWPRGQPQSKLAWGQVYDQVTETADLEAERQADESMSQLEQATPE